jgi:nitrate reductase NapD
MSADAAAPGNVSSLVIKTAPENVEKTIGELGATGICEVFFHDASGRIIVTIEGKDVSEEMRKLKVIQGLPHIVAADLVYSYSEHEVMEDLRKLDTVADPVPEALRSERRAD